MHTISRSATRRAAVLVTTTALLGGSAVGLNSVATAAASAPTDTPSLTQSHQGVPTVTNLRFGRHSRFDRAVMDIRGSTPSYSVRYLSSQPRECAGGFKVYPRGTRFLQITLRPARTHNNDGSDAYRGPGQTQSARVGLPTIKGVRVNCQFEGTVGIVLGLDHKANYRVRTLSNPTRVFVDVAH